MNILEIRRILKLFPKTYHISLGWGSWNIFSWGGGGLNRHISRIIILLLYVIAENTVSAESVNACYSLLNIVYTRMSNFLFRE